MNEQATDRQALSRSRARVVLVMTVLLIVIVAGFSYSLGGSALAGNASAGGTQRGAILVPLGGILLIALLMRGVHHAEHGLRIHTTVARSYTAADPFGAHDDPALPSGPSTASLPPGAGMFRRTYSPGGFGSGSIGFGVVAAGLVVIALISHSHAQRSAFVQKHGISTNATVVAVNNTQYCSRHGCHWTASIPVSMAAPVDGVLTPIVHYPGFSELRSGEQVAVLVDPREPAYAELPGHPFTRAWAWIFALVLAAAAAGMALLNGLGLVRVSAHRREHLAQVAPASGFVSSSA